MIPLRDNIPSRTTPVVNYAVIAVCTLVFLAQLSAEKGEDQLVWRYGMVPARVLNPGENIVIEQQVPVRTPFGIAVRRIEQEVPPAALPAWMTALTCIFLHGGWMHFLGNMWFLFIFGDNVEDRFGHLGYVAFYLGCGAAASLAHLVVNTQSTVPTIGASGAIAGVMGAYFALYPRAMVLTLVPIFIFLQIFVLPAPIFLGVWFLLQFFQGMFSVTAGQATGVAWWAHIGGFVAGLAVSLALDKTHHLRSRVEAVRPGADRLFNYRIYPRED